MNTVEGFFGIGAIVGPAILARLLASRRVVEVALRHRRRPCASLLIVMALLVRYPTRALAADEPIALCQRHRSMRCRSPYVLAFSTGAFLYVGVEAAIYVWMPTLLRRLLGRLRSRPTASRSSSCCVPPAASSAPGCSTRSIGTPCWPCSAARSWCASSSACSAGVEWAVYLLPLSGLFMSVIYPTINSKGISCLPKSEHGAAAGVILFFTCVSAVASPAGDGRRQRRDGEHRLWLLARNRVRGSPVSRVGRELVLHPRSHGSGTLGAGGARAGRSGRVAEFTGTLDGRIEVTGSTSSERGGSDLTDRIGSAKVRSVRCL